MKTCSGCEHIIGMVYDYENTRLVSLKDLGEHIEDNKRNLWGNIEPYTLSDYADKRKSTDLTRFEYCPCCGDMIDWKSIKTGGLKR